MMAFSMEDKMPIKTKMTSWSLVVVKRRMVNPKNLTKTGI